MAYDEGLAHRIREQLEDHPGIAEKRMFGGLCFLWRRHMVFGVVGHELMVRVGAEAYADALERPHAREMVFTGRSLTGFVYVGEEGIAEDEDLLAWLELGLRHAASLPPKPEKAARKRPAEKQAAKKRAPKKSAAKKRAPKKRAATKKAGKKQAPKKTPKRSSKKAHKRAAKKKSAKRAAKKKAKRSAAGHSARRAAAKRRRRT